MGKQSLLKKLGITLEDLVGIYTRVGSTKEAAKVLSCSDRTVRRYLRQAGIPRLPRQQLDSGLGAPSDRGCLGRWLRDHPEQELPHSVKAISRLTGCSPDEVKCYLYRKRKDLREFLKRLPPLEKVRLVLPTTKGYKVPTRAFSAYKLYLNKWNLSIKIVAWLKPSGKRVTLEVPASLLRSKLRLLRRSSPEGTPDGTESP